MYHGPRTYKPHILNLLHICYIFATFAYVGSIFGHVENAHLAPTLSVYVLSLAGPVAGPEKAKRITAQEHTTHMLRLAGPAPAKNFREIFPPPPKPKKGPIWGRWLVAGWPSPPSKPFKMLGILKNFQKI